MDTMILGLLGANLLLLLFLIFLVMTSGSSRAQRQMQQRLQELAMRFETYSKLENDEKVLLRQEREAQHKGLREEVGSNFERISTLMSAQLSGIAESQSRQMERVVGGMNELLKTNYEQQERIRSTLEIQMKELQNSNEQKLDLMRQTVDEKLQATLATRLDASFKQVGDQLQLLYKSMGEMQSLASGVNDLSRVLNNVKARGTWGEVQLGNLLE